MPERYITNSSSSDQNAVREGFKKTIELCLSLPYNKVTLQLPSKEHLRNLSGLLDEKTIRNLSDRNYSTWNNVNFTLTTQRIEIMDWTEEIILSLYPTTKMMDNLNNLKRAKAIVVIPWMDKERDLWIKTWSPQIIGDALVEIEDSLKLDTRLLNALNALSNSINLSTGLTHPSDKASAIQLLQILHQKGFKLIPDSLRIWALQNGWIAEGANQLRDYTIGVLEGKRYKISKMKMWNEDYLKSLLDS